MMSRAFRPIAAILAILLLTGVHTQAAPVAISEVIQVLGSYQNPPELRLRSVSQSTNSLVDEGEGPSPVASASQESAASGAAEIPDTSVSGEVTSDSTDTLLAGVAVTADPQAGVDVVDQGDVEGTICDCGEITVAGGGWPKWPLLFLAAIPLLHSWLRPLRNASANNTNSSAQHTRNSGAGFVAPVWFRPGGVRSWIAQTLCQGQASGPTADYGGGLIEMHKALNKRRAFKLVFAAFLALTFCVAHPSSTAYAKKRKLAKYGSIKILSTPGGFPIEIDGKSEGETTTDYRSFDRDPGLHTVVITLPNGQRWTREIDLQAGHIKCVAINFKASPPVVHSPCPYPVSITVDADIVNEGDIITFTADTAYQGSALLNYNWSLSPANAKILTSVGSKITVDSTSLAGQRITATVEVDDGSGEAACRQTAQASASVRPREVIEHPLKQFDVCCSCSFDDQKARLDNLGVELQNEPTSRTYVIAYGGRNSRMGQADLLGARSRDYLVTNRGIDSSRITVINGGYREEDCVELWVVPSGALPPQATPTLQPGDVRPAAPVRHRGRRRGRS